MAAKKPATAPAVASRPDRWFTPQKPEFIKLVVGESITGVYLGQQASQYGPNYRFQIDGKVKAINGNRVQIDSLMEQVEASGMKGHQLILERTPDDESSKGRKVHQYRVGHLPQGCPQCSK